MMMWIVALLGAPIALAAAALVLLVAIARLRIAASKATRPRDSQTLAFLHPFCNDGGGGERVLWVAIRELIKRGMLKRDGGVHWRVIVYTGDAVSDDEIRKHASSRFGVTIPAEVEFVRLRYRAFIEPKYYPVATLIGQALGSLLLGRSH